MDVTIWHINQWIINTLFKWKIISHLPKYMHIIGVLLNKIPYISRDGCGCTF